MIEAPEETRKSEITQDELLRFFSVLSHDLKSPIFSIDGFSELLLSDYANKLDEEGLDFLKRIRSSAQQMKRVLDDMSHLVKLLSRPNAPRPTDLKELVEELRLKYNFLIEEGDVKLDVSSSLPVLQVDSEKTREALSALLSNALFFTDREKGQREVKLDWDESDGMVRLTVSDNGVGIDPRYTDQIFDLGLKLDKSRGGGPGYGLFVARRAIESQGGKVEVESEPGEGSKFSILLPRDTRVSA